MISVAHIASGADDVIARARTALAALAARPGYLRGTLGRSLDDESQWVLVTEWSSVGAYRRALGSYEVRLHASPLLAEALELPSSFEPLVQVAPGGAVTTRASDRA